MRLTEKHWFSNILAFEPEIWHAAKIVHSSSTTRVAQDTEMEVVFKKVLNKNIALFSETCKAKFRILWEIRFLLGVKLIILSMEIQPSLILL